VTYLDSLSKVLPVILLFLLGLVFNRRRFLRPDTMTDLKNLVIKLTLPLALFLAFSRVSLEPRHAIIFAALFGGCVIALLVGRAIRPLFHFPSPYFPTLMTGFEAGMMGYAIYGAVYGTDNLFKFGIVDLGQVVFVFFVLVGVLERQTTQARPLSDTVRNFLRTPVIIGILLGIVANQLGVVKAIETAPLFSGVLHTIELLAGLTTPLIGLIIGYEMRLELGQIREPLKAIGLRLIFWLPIGLLINALVIDQLLHLDRGFRAAVLTMIVLPPPFVIPLFIKADDQANRTFVVNTLSLSTLVTLFAFAVVTMIYAP